MPKAGLPEQPRRCSGPGTALRAGSRQRSVCGIRPGVTPVPRANACGTGLRSVSGGRRRGRQLAGTPCGKPSPVRNAVLRFARGNVQLTGRRPGLAFPPANGRTDGSMPFPVPYARCFPARRPHVKGPALKTARAGFAGGGAGFPAEIRLRRSGGGARPRRGRRRRRSAARRRRAGAPGRGPPSGRRRRNRRWNGHASAAGRGW